MNPETLLERYRKARKDVATYILDVAVAAHNLKIAEAYAQNQAIKRAGGEKEFGPNEDARKRRLTVELASDGAYVEVVREHERATEHLTLAEAELDCIKFEMRFLEATLKEAEINKGNNITSHYLTPHPYPEMSPELKDSLMKTW